MSDDQSGADPTTADVADTGRSETDDATPTSELTDADLSQVAGSGYPQGTDPIDLSRWGLGR